MVPQKKQESLQMKKSLILVLVAVFALAMFSVACKKEENINTDTAVTDTMGSTDVTTDTAMTSTDTTMMSTDTTMTSTDTTMTSTDTTMTSTDTTATSTTTTTTTTTTTP
jgi:hypothetical protein